MNKTIYPIGIQDFSKLRQEEQIEEKQYADPFATDPRRLYKIGINFSTQMRGISEYEIAPQ